LGRYRLRCGWHWLDRNPVVSAKSPFFLGNYFLDKFAQLAGPPASGRMAFIYHFQLWSF